MTLPNFRRGAAFMERESERFDQGRSRDTEVMHEASLLPLEERERLCRDILAELGVTQVREGARGELIHPCSLPFSSHANQSKSPTASLNYERLVANCLGSCQAGGTLLWFIAAMRGDEDTTEARRWLEERAGTGPDGHSLTSLLGMLDSIYSTRGGDGGEPVPSLSVDVLRQWDNPEATAQYLSLRGISSDKIDEWRLGMGWVRVRSHASGEMVSSLRLVVPVFWGEDLVGWQSRRITGDGTAKWISSSGLPKDRVLFGHRGGRDAVVVMEAPLSVVSKSHLSAMGTPVATFGAKLTERQVRALSMHDKVVLFFDPDDAGWKSTHSVAEALAPYTSVWVVDYTYDADPADLDDRAYGEAVSGALPYAVWSRPKSLREWES